MHEWYSALSSDVDTASARNSSSFGCGRRSSSTRRSRVSEYSSGVVCLSWRTLSTHAVVKGRREGVELEVSAKSGADMTSAMHLGAGMEREWYEE